MGTVHFVPLPSPRLLWLLSGLEFLLYKGILHCANLKSEIFVLEKLGKVEFLHFGVGTLIFTVCFRGQDNTRYGAIGM